MSRTKDFVEENFDNAFAAARVYNPELCKIIEREKLLVSSISKPGNLYDHFQRFKTNHHKHAPDFKRLNKIDSSFITHENMADEIAKMFPEELTDKYDINNLQENVTHLSHYENLCVFGGNRQESFREKDSLNVGLILKPEVNDFRENRVIVNLENSKPSTKKRIGIVEGNRDITYYIMKKEGINNYLYVGKYRYISKNIGQKITELIFEHY